MFNISIIDIECCLSYAPFCPLLCVCCRCCYFGNMYWIENIVLGWEVKLWRLFISLHQKQLDFFFFWGNWWSTSVTDKGLKYVFKCWFSMHLVFVALPLPKDKTKTVGRKDILSLWAQELWVETPNEIHHHVANAKKKKKRTKKQEKLKQLYWMLYLFTATVAVACFIFFSVVVVYASQFYSLYLWSNARDAK